MVILITTSVTGPNSRSAVSHSAQIMLWKGPGQTSFLHYTGEKQNGLFDIIWHPSNHSPSCPSQTGHLRHSQPPRNAAAARLGLPLALAMWNNKPQIYRTTTPSSLNTGQCLVCFSAFVWLKSRDCFLTICFSATARTDTESRLCLQSDPSHLPPDKPITPRGIQAQAKSISLTPPHHVQSHFSACQYSLKGWSCCNGTVKQQPLRYIAKERLMHFKS